MLSGCVWELEENIHNITWDLSNTRLRQNEKVNMKYGV